MLGELFLNNFNFYTVIPKDTTIS